MATTGRGYDVQYVHVDDRDELRRALQAKTRLVWLETPTNPLMSVIDIAETARIVHEAGALLLVDNTFLLPYFQNPLDLGADFVLHSVTKYINGHSDAIGGAIVTNHADYAERIKFLQKSLGTNAQPFDSFLILRGIRTLAVRMEAHNRNALGLARFLERHPKVEGVLHPGLESHPQHALALRQMRGFGETFSFRLRGGIPEVHRFLDGLRIITLAESLGGKLQKNVTGYNLMPLLVGSEGTLGVITEITLRTVPLPTERQDLLALFPDTRSAIAVVPGLIARTGIVPASIEYLDRLSIQVTSRFLHDDLDYRDCGAALIFSLDGFSAERVSQDAERLRAFVLSHGAMGIEDGSTPERRERLWRVRRNLAKAFRSFSDFQTCEDISLPPARLPDMLEALQGIADSFGVQIASFGHAGDGNLHPRVVAPSDWTAERWHSELPRILAAIYRQTAALGGQLSGEHGIGEKRRDFIGLTVPPATLALMRAIKATLDPNGILNPDKILPE